MDAGLRGGAWAVSIHHADHLRVRRRQVRRRHRERPAPQQNKVSVDGQDQGVVEHVRCSTMTGGMRIKISCPTTAWWSF
jgi:hypothetical protein